MKILFLGLPLAVSVAMAASAAEPGAAGNSTTQPAQTISGPPQAVPVPSGKAPSASVPALDVPDAGSGPVGPTQAPGAALILWQGLAYGASPDDVRKAFKEAHANPAAKPTEKTGSLLVLDTYKLVDKDFTAAFIFEENKLTEVTLNLKAKVNLLLASTPADDLLKSLRSKYGNEIFTSRDRVPGLSNTSRLSWSSNGVTVELSVATYTSSVQTISLIYSTKLGKESNKL